MDVEAGNAMVDPVTVAIVEVKAYVFKRTVGTTITQISVWPLDFHDCGEDIALWIVADARQLLEAGIANYLLNRLRQVLNLEVREIAEIIGVLNKMELVVAARLDNAVFVLSLPLPFPCAGILPIRIEPGGGSVL